MVFAILAAGEGSRLADEGLDTPKPLVLLQGKPMIDRLVDIFMKAGAEKIVIIANDIHKRTKEHIDMMREQGLPIQLVVKTTPSSMHSFFELHPYIGKGKFCLTTVDTIFKESEFIDFISQFKTSDDDGMMAVTDFVDDEKPLYISHDDNGYITGFHDSLLQFRQSGVEEKYHAVCDVISGGIYCLDDTAFPTLRWCVANGMSRMRNFQRQLIADGLRLKIHKFSKILDVDHVDDIAKAEEFLA
ncbi:MAG: NTP transferase domain-containing protein [Bacteroidaceae bacterium]|nr:NTP transferase domain-containing protein [Bacteroidaceae bacterium]